MITIDQLLESVDLDFEPRFVTKDKSGLISIWQEKPARCDDIYHVDAYNVGKVVTCPRLKLAEFHNKHWTECIYEVPRKTDEYEQNLEKLRPADSDLVYRVKLPRKKTGKIEKLERHIRVENGYELSCPPDEDEIIEKINLLVEAVNKHADIIQQIGEWASSKGECLWCEALTKFEPKGLKGAKNE